MNGTTTEYVVVNTENNHKVIAGGFSSTENAEACITNELIDSKHGAAKYEVITREQEIEMDRGYEETMDEDTTEYVIVDTKNGNVIEADGFTIESNAKDHMSEELIRCKTHAYAYEVMTREEAENGGTDEPTWIQEFRDELESRGLSPDSYEFKEQMKQAEGMHGEIEQIQRCDHEEITSSTRFQDLESFFHDEIGGLDENPNLREADGIALRASCTECGKDIGVSLNVNVGVDE